MLPRLDARALSIGDLNNSPDVGREGLITSHCDFYLFEKHEGCNKIVYDDKALKITYKLIQYYEQSSPAIVAD